MTYARHLVEVSRLLYVLVVLVLLTATIEPVLVQTKSMPNLQPTFSISLVNLYLSTESTLRHCPPRDTGVAFFGLPLSEGCATTTDTHDITSRKSAAFRS